MKHGKLQRALLTGVLVGLASACTTIPVPLKYADSTPVPAERLSPRFASLQKAGGTAHIVVVRDRDDANAFVTDKFVGLTVDGHFIAHLAAWESISFYLPPGRYLLGYQAEKEDISPDVTGGLTEQELVVQVGTDYFYRLNRNPFSGLILQRSSLLQ